MLVVPAKAPFVVRNSTTRFVLQTILGAALTVAFVAAMVVFGLSIVLVFAALFGVVVVVLSVVSLVNSAPLLAADRAGVWVKAFRGADGVRHLYWNQIDRVYTHQISGQFRMLCVRPRHPELPADSGRRQTIQESVRLVGAPYSVNLVAAGLSDHQALHTIAGLAAGRCRVG